MSAQPQAETPALTGDTHERLLEAGTTLFASHGYEGTSVRMIADMASANVAAVAYHFGSKQGLYDAVIDRLYERLQQMQFNLPEAETPEELVDGLVEMIWDFTVAHRQTMQITMREVIDHGQLYLRPGWDWLDQRLEEFSVLVAQLLDVSPDRARLSMVTFSYTTSRYALNNPEELRRVVGVDTDEEAREALLAHLRDLARRMFLS